MVIRVKNRLPFTSILCVTRYALNALGHGERVLAQCMHKEDQIEQRTLDFMKRTSQAKYLAT